jgi:hypothetical protein
VTDAWMPGAQRVPAAADGGSMKGGAPRAVWLVLYADPLMVSARAAAERLSQLGRPCHLVWNPLSGEVAQLIPVVRAGRSLGWADGPAGAAGPGWAQAPGWWDMRRSLACEPVAPATRDGLAGVNTEGRVCAQIGVIGHAWSPFTDGPVARLHEIVSWLDSWHVPRGWPAGRPAAFPGDTRPAPPSRRDWSRGGHFGASQVPGCCCAGPGAIDIERLTGAATVAGPDRPGPRDDRARTAPGQAEVDVLAGAAAMPGVPLSPVS